MHGINTFKGISDYTTNKYVVDKVPSENIEIDKTEKIYEINISENQLLPKKYPTNLDDIEQSMCTDFANLSQWSDFTTLYFKDNTEKIDNIVDMSKKYTKYINDNFNGDKKQNYLDSLNGYVNFAKDIVSSEISFNIGKFFNLDKNDISDIKNNIDSIIDKKLKNTTIIDKTTSLKDMNYQDLKILNIGIEEISKSMIRDFYFSDGLNVSALGMAKMKTNFIVERTNLSDKIKTKLSDCVDKKITEELDSIYKALDFSQRQRKVFAKEKGVSLEEITGIDSSTRLEKLKERTSNTYKKFKNIKFDNNFMNNFLSIMKNINEQYLDDINYYKKVDAELGTGISKSISELQRTITDKLTCDWDNFIDKVYTEDEKSQYYLPSSSHNIVDTFA